MLRRLPIRTLAHAARLGALGLLAVLVAVAATLPPAGPLLAAGTLDQSQPSQNDILVLDAGVGEAQTFTAGVTGNLDQIDLPLAFVAGIGTFTIEIRDVVGGAPGPTVLASTTQPVTSLPAFIGLPVAFTSFPL